MGRAPFHLDRHRCHLRRRRILVHTGVVRVYMMPVASQVKDRRMVHVIPLMRVVRTEE